MRKPILLLLAVISFTLSLYAEETLPKTRKLIDSLVAEEEELITALNAVKEQQKKISATIMGSPTREELETAEMKAAELRNQGDRIEVKLRSTRDSLRFAHGVVTHLEYQKIKDAETALRGLNIQAKSVRTPELITAVDEIKAYVETLRERGIKEAFTEMDALVAKARETCLTATTNLEIDNLLIDLAAIQLPTRSSSDPTMRRVQKQREGLLKTLEAWNTYLDYMRAERKNQAQRVLKQLSTAVHYPVMKKSDLTPLIEALEEPDKISPRDENQKLLNSITTFQEAADTIPLLKQQRFQIANRSINERPIEILTWLGAAHQCLEEKNYQGVVAGAKERSISKPIYPFEEPLKTHLIRGLVSGLFKENNLEPGFDPDLPLPALIEAGARQMYQEDLLPETAYILQAQYLLPTEIRNAAFPLRKEEEALHQYRTYLRFKEAGDELSQLMALRNLVKISDRTLIPEELGVKQLKELIEKNPELADDSHAIVLQEIESLKLRLRPTRMLDRRSMIQKR